MPSPIDEQQGLFLAQFGAAARKVTANDDELARCGLVLELDGQRSGLNAGRELLTFDLLHLAGFQFFENSWIPSDKQFRTTAGSTDQRTVARPAFGEAIDCIVGDFAQRNNIEGPSLSSWPRIVSTSLPPASMFHSRMVIVFDCANVGVPWNAQQAINVSRARIKPLFAIMRWAFDQ